MKKKKWDKRNTRMPFCYDKQCKILYSTYNKKSHREGFSFFCYGKLPKPYIFVEKKAKHINDLCHCYYTPLKGAIRFFLNEGDLWGEAWAKVFTLNRLIKPKCQKCKGRIYKEIRHICHKCDKRNEKI